MAEQKQSVSKALPKNIRQIGTNTGNTRVYLEDYVYTYLHTQEEIQDWSRRGFMLIGKIERDGEYVRYFISGMIRLKDSFFKDGLLEFDDNAWAYIYQEMKKYYDDLDIVGWGQDVSGASAGMTADIERSHKQNFNIQKNVLFLLDFIEHEEAFYVFEKNMLQRREGYYVYYEKNPQMQEYMIGTRKEKELDISVDEIKEPLVRSYRETLLDKKEQLAARKWNGVLYTTSMLLVLSVCVLGVSTVNNVEKMQNLETAVNQISGQSGQADAAPAMSRNTNGASDTDKNTQDSQAPKKTGKDKADQEKEEASTTESSKGDSTEIESSSKKAKKDKGDFNSLETAALDEAQTYLLQGYYIVKKGDSLASISKKIYGTAKKAKKICDLNGIEDMDKIYAGQKLELP